MVAILFSVFLLAVLWAVVVVLQLPLAIAIVATAALVLTWVVALVFRRWRARRAAGHIEKALASQAGAHDDSVRPDQRAEIDAMRAEFSRAVQALKGSKLARGGRDALAVLPWYMIIGPPGAGKSTALRASGLKFPYQSKRGSVRGVGGTRNCEWWLTNEAVLLDTAGRYSTEEEDHEEWTSFLDTIGRARRRKPFNGLLVAVPITDAGSASEDEAAELGRVMRERVDEVMSRLQVVLPVYVLFTKCDLLPGFVETFADLRKADRGQICGFTYEVGQGGDARELFVERFDELLAAIEERSWRRIGDERQLASRERIYEFPQQLEALKGGLAAFVDALFTENVYQDTPILRGVYLTSGTQEGRVIDRVMSAMADAFGVSADVAAAEPVLEAKSYFLRDVFAKVLFPDQHLAFRNSRAIRRDAVRRWALGGAAAVAVLLFVVFPVRSFLANRELVKSTGRIVEATLAKLAAAPGRGPPPVGDLEPIRERYAMLERQREQGPPWSMRIGLYRGDDVLPYLRRVYAAAVRRFIVEPVFRQDLDDMEAFARRVEGSDVQPDLAEHARFFDKLRLHLLLTRERAPGEPAIGEAEAGWIAAQVADRWGQRVRAAADPAVGKEIQRDVRLFAKSLAVDPAMALVRDERIVRRERTALARLPSSVVAVQRLTDSVTGKVPNVTLGSLVGPVAALRASGEVRAAFTRAGYEEIRKKLDDPAQLLEPWVLADAEGKKDDEVVAREVERLRSRYFERYIEEWRRFVDGIAVERGSRALPLLQDLTSGEPPPYARLLQGIAEHTRISGVGGVVAKEAAGYVEKARAAARKLIGDSAAAGLEEAATRRRDPERLFTAADVERAFAGLVAFGVPVEAKGGAPPKKVALDAYLEQLAFVRDAMQAASEGGDSSALLARVAQARTRTQALIDSQEIGWRPRLTSLLWPPLETATSSSIGEASRDLSQKWCAAVATPFRRTLAGRYPFTREGDDAALADVAEFFRPSTGILWAFYNDALKASVQRAGDGFRFARQVGGSGLRPEILPFLRRASDVTAALFPAGSPEPKVSFAARIRAPTSLDASRAWGAPEAVPIRSVLLEIDGQQLEYQNGLEEWRNFVWPGPGKTSGALLRVTGASGRDEFPRTGDWGLFHLIDDGEIKPGATAREFSVTYELRTLRAAVTIDFRPARTDSPFFGAGRATAGRLLEPFHNAASIPLDIGRGGSECR